MNQHERLQGGQTKLSKRKMKSASTQYPINNQTCCALMYMTLKFSFNPQHATSGRKNTVLVGLVSVDPTDNFNRQFDCLFLFKDCSVIKDTSFSPGYLYALFSLSACWCFNMGKMSVISGKKSSSGSSTNVLRYFSSL